MTIRHVLAFLIFAVVAVVALEYFSRPPRPSPQSPLQRAKAASRNKLEQIVVAVHGFHDEHGCYANTICDRNGKPLLSWRVAVLPFLGQEALHKQFRLDEPWDSRHNEPLIQKMPDVFRHELATAAVGQTHFRGFNGPGAFFEVGKRLHANSFVFYGDKIVTVVEAHEPAVWTEPNDFPVRPGKAAPAARRAVLRRLPGGHGLRRCRVGG